jgi:hypothetical protein
MNTTLLVLDDNNQWQELDLYEDLSINVIIQETDITDIEARRSPYSKTFEIPGTNINNDFFEHFYEVNGIGFDPLTRRQCVVQYRGADIFKGYLRLNSVTRLGDGIAYEVYILSEVTDFSSIVADKQLNQLDWNYLNHILNYDTVVQSWNANSGDVDGLFGGKIIYPMIHWGYQYQSATASTPTFEFAINTTNNKGIDFSGSSIPPTYFKPAIRLKEVLNLIFSGSGYQIVSNFFDSPYFKSIYMDIGVNGKLGVETASAKTNQNVFRVYGNALPNAQEFKYSQGVTQQISFGRISSTDGYDPTTNFNQDRSCYQIPYSGLYSFEFKGKVNQRYANNYVSTYYGFSLFKASSPERLLNPATRTAVGGTVDSLRAFNYSNSNNQRIFFNNIQLNAGDYVGLFIRFNTSSSSYRDAGLWVGPTDWAGANFGARWDLYNSPTFIANDTVEMKLQFPETSCLDYVKAIVKMFNLVVVQTDDDKKIRMEPLPWYYAQNFADTKDWTQRLDITSPVKIEPVNFQLKKGYNFQYLNGEEEHLNKLWQDQYDIPYGTKKFTAEGDILTGEETIEFPFRACPTDVISGSTNIIIPQFYKFDIATGRSVAYSNKNHLFFWTGNRFFYGQSGNTQPKTWFMTSGATPIAQTTYPCVSHLSTLDSLDPLRISDLNFDKSFDFFGEKNTVIEQFTSYNLFQTWYGDYFTNLYSPEVKRVTAKILFEPIQIGDINLTDKIFLKDSLFNIEKINEGDLVDWKLTEVSLLKVVAPYNKIEPPAPFYTVSPNQSYPASGTNFTLSGFVSTSQGSICSNAVSASTFYSSTSTLVDGTYIYQTSGTTAPYTTGTFVRQTTGSTVYVVINNLGQILQNDC